MRGPLLLLAVLASPACTLPDGGIIACQSDTDCPAPWVCGAQARCAMPVASDAGSSDAGPSDAGVSDAGPRDAGPADAGVNDAGISDAGAPDSGVDAGYSDAGPGDAGPPDSGPADAGRTDAGPADAGRPDSGPADAGPADAGRTDSGPLDAGIPDAGTQDAGEAEDAGETDAGAPDAGLFDGGLTPLPPDAPTGVTAVAGVRSAVVSWTASKDNGNQVTSYTVTPFDGTMAGTPAVVDGGTTKTTISQLANGTTYTFQVVAANAAGTSPPGVSNMITTPTPPAAPTDVMAAYADDNLNVSWTAPSGPVTGYFVYTTSGVLVGSTAAGSPLAISTASLTVGSSYAFVVAAANTAGLGPQSSPSNTITIGGTPDPPTGVTATGGLQSATVQWTAPTNTGSIPLTAYVITSVTSAAAVPPVTVDASLLQVTVTGLANGTAYYFTVVATNGAASSQATSSNSITTDSAPGEPPSVGAVASVGGAIVTWHAPMNGGAQIMGYVVTPYTGGVAGTSQMLGSSALMTTFTGLANGTVYTFEVSALNAVGTGSPGTSNPITTPNVPNAPAYVVATPGHGLIMVTWTVPGDNGNAITGYVATASPGGQMVTTGTTPFISFSPVTVGTQYTFAVQAQNQVGLGPPSAPSNVAIVCASGNVQSGDACVPISMAPPTEATNFAVDAAHDNDQPTDAIASPLTPLWTATFTGQVSYPIVTGGMVILSVFESPPNIRALDVSTGDPVWGPIETGADVWLAYDGGLLYALDGNGLLTAYDATTGAQSWSTAITAEYFYWSPPTAAGGMVIVNGLGEGGVTTAVNEQNGAFAWNYGTFDGSDGTVGVGGGAVYEAEACDQLSSLNLTTGAVNWFYWPGQCTGGGGAAPSYYEGLIWERDWAMGNVIITNTGVDVGTFPGLDTPPAFDSGTAFYMSSPNLTSVNIQTQQQNWSFAGDGTLCTSAVIAGANSQVFVGGSSGNVYELDEATGLEISSNNAGTGVTCGSETTGMTIAEGHLFVPAGDTLVVY